MPDRPRLAALALPIALPLALLLALLLAIASPLVAQPAAVPPNGTFASPIASKSGGYYRGSKLRDWTLVAADGTMRTDTCLGDRPGWVLLSEGMAATASSSLDGHPVAAAFDEDIRTQWSAPPRAACATGSRRTTVRRG